MGLCAGSRGCYSPWVGRGLCGLQGLIGKGLAGGGSREGEAVMLVVF